MVTRLLKPKKKGNNGWMKGFVIPPRNSDMDNVEGERMAVCKEVRSRIIKGRRDS